MKYFPRLLLLAAILFVTLGLFGGRNTRPDGQTGDLEKIECSSIQAGLLPDFWRDPPSPSGCNLFRGPAGTGYNPAPDSEESYRNLCALRLTTLNVSFINRKPELNARTGRLQHRILPDTPPDDPT